jgi:hypothetical protein
MVSFRKEIGKYAVDHTLFNHMYELDTPLCSAKDLDELNKLQDEMQKQGDDDDGAFEILIYVTNFYSR